MRSSSLKRSTASAAWTRAAVASCDSTTPLLLAVVPEVNRMKAGFSPPNSAGPSAPRSIHRNVNPSHTPPDTIAWLCGRENGSAPGQARQPFSWTSANTWVVSAGVR